MKLIMESWRGYLNEAQEITVGGFLDLLQAQAQQGTLQKLVSSKASKFIAFAVGTGLTALIPGGQGPQAALGGAVAGVAIDKLADHLRKSLPKMLLALKDLPDDQTQGTAFEKFDLDDEAQALTRGGEKKDGPILQEFSKFLLKKYEGIFGGGRDTLSDENLNKPLSDFLSSNANEYFNEFLENEAQGFGGPMNMKVNINRKIVNT